MRFSPMAIPARKPAAQHRFDRHPNLSQLAWQWIPITRRESFAVAALMLRAVQSRNSAQ